MSTSILTCDWLSVRANTRKGYGPWSTQSSFRTDRNIVRAPLNVKAMATSDSSVQVTITYYTQTDTVATESS